MYVHVINVCLPFILTDDTSTTQPTSTGSTSGIDKKEKKSKRNLGINWYLICFKVLLIKY